MCHTTDTLIMVEPNYYGFNPETAVNNSFMNKINIDADKLQRIATLEFNNMVAKLEVVGIDIIVIPSVKQSFTHDAVFPNNWFSTHRRGEKYIICVYPMFSPNRNKEVQVEVLQTAIKNKVYIDDYMVFDLRHALKEEKYLEGTGSLVLDRTNKIAFLSLSERGDKEIASQWAQKLGYELFCFHSYDKNEELIYHTNVVLSIGSDFAITCMEAIHLNEEKQGLYEKLTILGKTIIDLSLDQIYQMAANILEVKNKDGEPYLILSKTANDSLTQEQKKQLDNFTKRIICDISTIEYVSGGSARCMVAEIF